MKRSSEVSVGILITVAAVVLVLGTLWLARGGLHRGYPLYTRFEWGQNLKTGQPVLLAGVSVGTVQDVTLRRNGYLDVMLSIDPQYTVPKGSTATVKPVGIFGDVSVALTPPTPVPAASYSPGDTLPPGPPSADIGEIMNRVDTIGQSVSILMRAVQAQVVDAGTLKDLHRTMASAAALAASTGALSAQLQRVVAEQNNNVTQTMSSFRDFATHLNGVVDSSQIRATTDNLRRTSENLVRLSANFDSTNAQLRALLAEAQHGNGNVAKLLADTMLYHNLTHSAASIDSLIADIKANPRKYIPNLRIF